MNNLTLVIPLIASGISAVVSITSIFVSNWLGRKTQLKQAKHEHKKEIYLSLYVPLLKWFHASNFMEKSYYWQVAFPAYTQGGRDPLSDLLMENFEKLPVQVAMCYSDYTQLQGCTLAKNTIMITNILPKELRNSTNTS